ncbi:MAG TPA: TIM barrel protein, partial [Gemmataceae bacterium]
MPIGRREFLALAASGAALALGEDSPKLPRRTGMGIGSSSYAIRSRAEKGFTDPLKFLEFCHERGAGGVQVPIGARDAEYAKSLRQRVEELGMYLEGSLRTPRDESDVGRFEGEVRTARGAGASVVRTVMLSGRRYETFKSSDEFRAFHKSSLSSLQLAEPVLARHKMKLAVENHKDYRTDQLADLMRRMDSEFIGVCVDTGNNIALLDDALETAKTLAPW